MTTLTQFLPYVLPYVLGCPDSMALQVLRSVCIDFCTTSCLVQSAELQNVVAGTQDYDIDLPTGTNLARVLAVFLGDKSLRPRSLESITSGTALIGTDGPDTPETNAPRVFFQKTPSAQAISLYPIPAEDKAKGLLIRAAYAPARSALSVADELFDDWAEVLAAGAISRLMAMNEQTFSNAKLADVYANQYNAGVRSASIQARAGLIVSASRVKARAFT